MTEILCSVCNRVNDASAERCWYCQALLSSDQVTSGTKQDDTNPPELFGSYPENAISNSNAISDSSDNEAGEENVPDWLARIRQLEKEVRLQQSIPEPSSENVEIKDETVDTFDNLHHAEDSTLLETRDDELSAKTEASASTVTDFSNATEDSPFSRNGEDGDPFDALLAELGIGKTGSLTNVPPPTPEEFQPIEGSIQTEGAEKVGPDGLTELPLEIPASDSEQTTWIRPSDLTDEPPEPDIPFIEEARRNLEPEIFQQLSEDEGQKKVESLVGETTSNEDLQENIPLEKSEPEIIPLPGEETASIKLNNDDLPEWLVSGQSSPEKVQETIIIPEPEMKSQDEVTLEKAHLPAWLKAIRPIETITPEPRNDSFEEEEKGEGILAGIEGTLRSARLTGQVKKPKLYTTGVQGTERQQQNAALFQHMLQGTVPEMTLTTSEKPAPKSSSILRFMVVILLLAAVILPILSPSMVGISPVLFPAEVVNTFSAIQNLPFDKPVLLVAHFEAGLAGELSWTSRSIVEHLMSRNIPITVISTNSIGYAMLEKEIQEAGSNEPGYAIDEMFVNLGYLPGSSLGILSLARDLRLTAPFTVNLQPAWKKPVLQNINKLSDFSAVIIFTDNAEIVRSWVEQAGPTLKVTPILAVTSAQSAPMIQPYYDSGQIAGFVAGMNGSLVYEKIMQRPLSASVTFGSYQMVLLMTAAIVFLGGVVSLILSSSTAAKKNGGKS